MSQIWFCSDLHLGHKNIQKYRKEVESTEDNSRKIYTDLIRTVNKRDTLYVLGDSCFDAACLPLIRNVTAEKKILVMGNHDMLPLSDYLSVFDEVHGLMKRYGMWLSHAPVHPAELRGKMNIHGHVHYASLDDPRYINVCPEALWPKYGRCLVSLQELRADLFDENTK